MLDARSHLIDIISSICEGKRCGGARVLEHAALSSLRSILAWDLAVGDAVLHVS